MAERGCGLGLVSEPYMIPANHPCWISDVDGSAAIYWNALPQSPPCTRVEAGVGYVAATWGSVSFVSVYAPPRWDLARFEQFLEEVELCVERMRSQSGPGRVVVAGDFNAKSALWGSPVVNARGRTLEACAADIGLCLVNVGRARTCVRRRGSSVIDVTWATPAAARCINGWGVVSDNETLSDHQLIRMRVGITSLVEMDRRRDKANSRRRWALKQVNSDLFIASILAMTWGEDQGDAQEGTDAPVDVDAEAEDLRLLMERACDVSMPRLKNNPPRRTVYWWSSEIANLRRVANSTKRRWMRARAGRRGSLDEEEAGEAWRSARQDLSRAIKAAKESSTKIRGGAHTR
ncbi:uncharacterized protein [Temnothorax nylanderi]|uniref:uncharacterized protein n=1 Tax=Temnothorax nylanderi TaxID=102681 RepID=UPI003A84D36B